MKILYSSTFFSAILGFLILLDQGGKPIEVVEAEEKPSFSTIIEHQNAEKPEEGKTKISIFTSFTCSTCKAFGLGTFRELRERYGNQEAIDLKIHLVPNKDDEIDMLATKAALCAADQEKFGDMLQKLYEMEAISADEINTKALEIQLDEVAFSGCLEDEGVNQKIDDAWAQKEKEKIDVTPSTLVNNILFIGAHPVENVEREIRRITN